MITSSRRTSKECIKQIKNEVKKLKIKSIFWDINDKTQILIMDF